jgi:uncharacterized protein YggE
MKKLIHLLVIVAALSGMSRAQAQESNTISVVGRAEVKRTVSAYKAKMVLNMDQVYYSNPECVDLESLKEKYFAMLKEKGIDPSKFIENKLAYTSYGYQKAGTVLEYETTQLNEIEILTSNKINGIQVSVQYKTIITEKQKEMLIAKAFENAQKNAELLCKIANQKISRVKSITETTLNTAIWNGYYNDHLEYINMYVTYEIE